jgi:hypothetical protein
LISRASGLAATKGSAPSISILISDPLRRSRTGIDRIWISSSVTLGNGVAATSSGAPSRPKQRRMSIWSTPTAMRSIKAVRTARWRIIGNSGQRFPISWARAASLRGVAGSAKRVEVAWQMLPGSRSHRRTRLVTSCSISTAGMRSPADPSVWSLVISGRET